MNFKSGDMLHYKPHDHTGILTRRFVRDGISFWKYALRSPRLADRQYHLINEFEVEVDRLLKAIEQGDLVYYACR